MSRLDRIRCSDDSAIELCERDDGQLELCVIVKRLGAATPVVLTAKAEKDLSVKLAVRERRRIDRLARRRGHP